MVAPTVSDSGTESLDDVVEALELELDFDALSIPDRVASQPQLQPQLTVAVAGRVVGPPPSRTLLDTYAEDARLAIARYERELLGEEDPRRLGRLHYEIARLYEQIIGEPEHAANHYRLALQATPDALPAVTGARRLLLSRGRPEAALELFDREIRITADRPPKAGLLLAKGRVLEDRLRKPEEARVTYAAASELIESDPVVLKALEHVNLQLGDWDRVIDALERTANAVVADPRHRAAVVARRARLVEVHRSDPDAAVELYAASLEVDDGAPGSLDALKRLHYERHRWRELIAVLELEAQMASDPVVRTMALYRIGQVHAERLGNRSEAIAALERAAKELPVQPVVLEALARLYERADALQPLAATLSRLVECTDEPRERLGYLHRIGEICRDGLQDDEAAMRAYEAALEIDPTYIPALRALAPLLVRHERWEELVRMHEAEAAGTNETSRRAVAHARSAEILERLGRNRQAIEHHEHALALDPALAGSFRALIRLFTESEQHHKLVELYERALDRVDVERQIEYLFAIGDLYRAPIGDPEQAEYAYRRILKLRPDHLGAVHALQRTAEAAGRYPQLVEALEREADTITDKPEIVALLHRAGEILHERLGDRIGAVQRFKRVLDINGYHVGTLASLGRIYHMEGHWADLVEIYARELEVTPDGPAAVALLHKKGEVHARYLADLERAADCFRKALAIDPRHGPSLHALSRLLAEEGRYRELVDLIELERDGYRDPQSRAMASFRAGEIYEDHLEDKIGAERCYADALQLRPSFRPAADALARVRSQLRHWEALAKELEHQAATISEPSLAIGALLRAGEVWWDDLVKPGEAIRCYEEILDREPNHLGALLAIEPLYRKTKDFEKLADIYARQVLVLTDGGAKAAALAERARVLEGMEGRNDDLVDVYTSVLALRPRDRNALDGLERQALGSADPRVLASVDARLALAVTDSALRSAYLTRQAECLETAGQPQALQVYRQALELDPSNRGALRGLGRLAEVLGDGEAMAEAAGKSAAVAKHPRDAADAWVRSGTVRTELLGDTDGAIADFERALAKWADHRDAAERLSRLLRQRGDVEVLVERLSRAAADAREVDRVSALWIEVARLYADDLGNLGAALSALKRLTGAQPKNPRALLELGRLLAGDRRYDEAIILLDRCISLSKDDEHIRLEAHFVLARSHEQNGDEAAAVGHYERALELAPSDQRILERVVEMQLRGSRYEAAIETASRLLDMARGDTERASAHVDLARAQAGAGQLEAALQNLAAAVAMEGPHGRAAEEVVGLATTPDHWRAYATALRDKMHEITDERRSAALHLELARVLHDRLEQPDEGLAALVEGLRTAKNDSDLRFELGKRLRHTGRPVEALEQFQYLLMDDVVRAEVWRYLAQTFEQLGRTRERLMALAALAVMDEAAPGELDEVRAWQPRTTAVPPAGLVPGVAAELFVAKDQQVPAATLLAAMADGLGKLRNPDLAPYGVGSRDKIAPRSEHPLRVLVDHIGGVLGIEDYEVYVHRSPEYGIAVENTAKPTLLLPAWLAELPRAQQVFLVTQPMVNLARGIYPIDMFSARELSLVVAAAVRTVVPDFGSNLATADELDERQRLIIKGVPRRKRKIFEAAAEAYAKSRPIEVATFAQWAKQSARRVALVLADDLLGAMQALVRAERLEGRGIALVRNSPVVADLLKVWVSKPAMMIRQRCGLLPGAALPAVGGTSASR